jgi:apolipoprotein N-acyltransferase
MRYSAHDHKLLLCPRRLSIGILVVLSALLLGAAPWYHGHPWIVWFAFVPLLFAIQSLNPPKAALAGVVWGLCIILCSLAADSVTPGSQRFSSAIAILGALAGYGYAGAVLRRRAGFGPLLLAVAWVAVEVVLGASGLPNRPLSATHPDAPLTGLVADTLGYGFVGFAVVLANGLLLAAAGIVLRHHCPVLLGCAGVAPACQRVLSPRGSTHPGRNLPGGQAAMPRPPPPFGSILSSLD